MANIDRFICCDESKNWMCIYFLDNENKKYGYGKKSYHGCGVGNHGDAQVICIIR